MLFLDVVMQKMGILVYIAYTNLALHQVQHPFVQKSYLMIPMGV